MSEQKKEKKEKKARVPAANKPCAKCGKGKRWILTTGKTLSYCRECELARMKASRPASEKKPKAKKQE